MPVNSDYQEIKFSVSLRYLCRLCSIYLSGGGFNFEMIESSFRFVELKHTRFWYGLK